MAGVVTAPGVAVVSASDQEVMERLLARTAGDVVGVQSDAGAIVDPVVKQAAVLEWLRRNLGHVDSTRAAPLCRMLGGIATDTCVRRLASPHLQTRPTE